MKDLDPVRVRGIGILARDFHVTRRRVLAADDGGRRGRGSDLIFVAGGATNLKCRYWIVDCRLEMRISRNFVILIS